MTSDRHKDAVEALSDSDHAVLDAARASILDVGWRRTTLTDVARRAGISRMTLYRRWPDMPGLLGDLMTREWTTAMARVVGESQAEESLLEQVRRGVVQVARAIRDDELFAKIIHVDPELLLPYLLDRRGRSQEMVLRMLEPLLSEGQRRNQIRTGDPALIARTLVLTAQGFTLSLQTMTDDGAGPAEADFEAELGVLVERYLAP